MKNSRRMFILIEGILVVAVIVLTAMMLLGKSEKPIDKISVIIQNSDDNQWSAFKYGLKKAAEDTGAEVFVVSTDAVLTVEEEKKLIENEIQNGASAVIVEPVVNKKTKEMLKKIEKQVPVILVGTSLSDNTQSSVFPVVEPENYEMGKALAEQLRKDYDGSLNGKTIGILSETKQSETFQKREKGFLDGLKDTAVNIIWSVTGTYEEPAANQLLSQKKADIVIGLDDGSLNIAGACSASGNLWNADVYGIGSSTEAIYYLDTGAVQCLVVPDDFNVGYKSLTETTKTLRHMFRKMKSKKLSYTVIRREALFSKENQEIIFTMSQ